MGASVLPQPEDTRQASSVWKNMHFQSLHKCRHSCDTRGTPLTGRDRLWFGSDLIVYKICIHIMATLTVEHEEGDMHRKLRYEKLKRLGEGTYAVVYLVRDRVTNQLYAMKKIKKISGSSGLDFSALREIKWLSHLRHPNIVKLEETFIAKAHIHMVLSHASWDLEMLIKSKEIVFMPSDIKAWMLMILRGLDYCHQNWVLHRDIKPSNMLIQANGTLQLADFGLARDYAVPRTPLSPNVVTRWYKAPELLLGSTHYTQSIDTWAVGCIFAELMLRKPYLPGDSDLEQLKLICKALGTPTRESWPGIDSLPDWVELPFYGRPNLNLQFSAASADAIDLLSKLLELVPANRITAREALMHPYFINIPRPTPVDKLPKP
ncbi:TFIIH complex serine/threonine-protein kinase subunit kin28 [Mitosporidium daphniae]